jgi:hypothetical protein
MRDLGISHARGAHLLRYQKFAEDYYGFALECLVVAKRKSRYRGK